ncbi:MAG: tRNA pseudouridine(38-40) synthase TruA [Campylobacterales bacterium]|nr:tRNA pseudouridine(38-40) synthase TruA [Campylobacterales bacterium]
MRVAATLAYDGTHYFGSQIQAETPHTIFGVFEKVLLELGIDFRVVASGRTDKGVHATGQVCHFDLPKHWSDLFKLKRALNHKLPNSIKVIKLQRVAEDFHARYSATKRSYRYIIKVGESNPFQTDYITFVKELNFTLLHEKMPLFVGEHDFEYFMKTGSEIQSTQRVIYKSFAYRYKGFIILHFQANGFLRSQIRMMVAALLQLSQEEIKEKLSKKKDYKIKPAPSNGLYLAKISY